MRDETRPSAPAGVRSRRQLIAGMAMALGALAATKAVASRQTAAKENPGAAPDPRRTTLHYQVGFKATPQRIYEVLLDAKLFAACTGLPAEIDPAAGGAFSLFGGQIKGRNVELVPNQRIVQAWRPGHWDPGVYSIVRFELKPRGAESTLILDHAGFPAGDAAGLDSGWHEHYLDTLQKYFAQPAK